MAETREKGSPEPEQGNNPRSAASDPRADATSDATVVKPRPSDAGVQPLEIGTTVAAPRPNDHIEALKGKQLSHYLIEETLGVGGMATVVRARDLSLERVVALKILPPSLATDADTVLRFHNEARSAAKLDDEHISRVYSYGSDQGLHFIAYEFVEGETLRARIQRHGRLPVAEVLNYAWQIAKGLEHAADRGVVHRDIKPSNILITPSGKAKLVDMGLARSMALTANDGLTHSGVTLGTFDYISPEQAMDPRKVDCRSDLYSLGCTLYHALTGQSPVPHGTALRKLQAHQQEPPLDPRDLNPAVPDAVAELLGRLMAKDPSHRPSHPREVVTALEQLGAGPATVAPSPLKREKSPEEDSVPARGPLLLLGFLLLVAIVIVTSWLHGFPQQTLKFADIPAPTGDFTESGVGNSSESVPKPRVAATSAELIEALKDHPQGTIVLTGQRYEFDEDINVNLAGSELTLRAAPEARPQLRRINTLAQAQLRGRQALLRVEGGTLRLQSLRFEIGDATGTGSFDLVALEAVGARIVAEDCEFQQEGDPTLFAFMPTAQDQKARRERLTVMTGNARKEEPAVLELHRCLLAGGQIGLNFGRGVQAQLRDCVVGPYVLPFLIEDVSEDPLHRPAELQLNQVTCVANHAVVTLESRERIRLELRDSVFAPTQTNGNPNTLLLFGRSAPAKTELRTVGNAFCQFDSLAALNADVGQQPLARSFDELAALMGSFNDQQSIQDPRSPWLNLSGFSRALVLESNDRRMGFRLRPNLASLRSGPQAMKGARTFFGEPLYDAVEPLVTDSQQPPPTLPLNRESVVDGLGRMPGTYSTVAAALAATSGDADVNILIRQNGPVLVRHEELRGRKVTLRGAPGFTPELIPHPDQQPDAEGDATLFRLRDASLVLEQLAIRLPPRTGLVPRLQSVVILAGASRCRLASCQVTLLNESDQRSCLALLVEPELDAGFLTILATRRNQPTAIELVDTLLRGRGDGIVLRRCPLSRIDAQNIAAALQGTFIVAETGRSAAESNQETCNVLLDRCSIFASSGLAWLRGNALDQGNGQIRFESVSQCLLARTEGQPLLRVEGLRLESDLKRVLSWRGRRNLIGLGPMLSWQPPERFEMPRTLDVDRWQELWGRDDEQSRFARTLRFAGNLEARTSFETLTPGSFRPLPVDASDMEIETFGADLNRIYFSDISGSQDDR